MPACEVCISRLGGRPAEGLVKCHVSCGVWLGLALCATFESGLYRTLFLLAILEARLLGIGSDGTQSQARW